LILGAVAVPLLLPSAFAFVVFAAVVALTLVRSRSRALGGGVMVSFGLWWLWAFLQAEEGCAAFNAQPGGRCTLGDYSGLVALALCVIATGVLVIGYELLRPRPAGGGGLPLPPR
jgi:hypothetical protein